MAADIGSIIAEHLDVPHDKVTPDTQLTELGASSYDLVTLIVRFEEEFGIYVEEDEIRQLRTVADVERLVCPQS